jgi:hypothetical protein
MGWITGDLWFYFQEEKYFSVLQFVYNDSGAYLASYLNDQSPE